MSAALTEEQKKTVLELLLPSGRTFDDQTRLVDIYADSIDTGWSDYYLDFLEGKERVEEAFGIDRSTMTQDVIEGWEALPDRPSHTDRGPDPTVTLDYVYRLIAAALPETPATPEPETPTLAMVA